MLPEKFGKPKMEFSFLLVSCRFWVLWRWFVLLAGLGIPFDSKAGFGILSLLF